MRQITQQQIAALAPNAAADANARKISQKGGIVRRECSADETFYLGECTGSGKNNYIATADFIDPAQPVFRCSCPSRQFPCKHSLALLYEISSEKEFTPCEIPEDILQKREKKQARAVKAETGGDKPAAPPKANKSAWTKKLKKQVEGLDLTARLVGELLSAGLGTMGGMALDTYRQLAKQLGDYYLPGPQRGLNRLILEIAAYQRDGEERHYEKAILELEALWALVKKSRQYLTQKLESGQMGLDGDPLYEELGGVWKLAELEGLGLVRPDARMAQLAFWVEFDEARGEYIDTGCWADIDTGEVCFTRNYRPLKALKYVKQEDSVFGAAKARAVFYPGEGNRRVRWEGAEIEPLSTADLAALTARASASVAATAKEAKNLLKNTLADPAVVRLVRFSRIGACPGGLALSDEEGGTILLQDMPGMEPTVERLTTLPDPALLEKQTLLGALWYDGRSRRLAMQPLSILTPDNVVRLLY